MKFTQFIFAFLGVLFLVGCDSEKKVDRKVQDYVMEEYGFEVDFIYRESLNEGNMGDRIYQVQRKDDPKVDFTVDLMGMWETDVVGDDYKIQEQAFLIGQKFLDKYNKEISKLKITDVVFRQSNGLLIEANYNSTISTFKEDTIQPLMNFINLLNAFKAEEKFEGSLGDLHIYYEKEKLMQVHQIETVTSVEQLKEQLYTDLELLNESLKERDEPLFIELENELNNLGYEYAFGLKNEDPLFESFGCYQDYYEKGECTEGYRMYLVGESIEKDKIFQLIQYLNSHPTLKFQDITISNQKDERIIFEDIKLIKNMSDIDTVYSGTDESLGRVILNK